MNQLRHHHYKTISDVAKLLNSELDLPKLLKNIVYTVSKKLGYPMFSIMLLKNGHLQGGAIHGMKDKTFWSLRIPLGKGVTGRAAKLKKTIVVDDVTKEKNYIDVDIGSRSEMAVPLVHRGKVLGVFNLEDPQVGAFSSEDVEVTSLLSDHIASAIHNAQLVQEMKDIYNDISVLYDTSTVINSTLVVDNILAVISDIVVKKLNHKRFSVLFVKGNKLIHKAGTRLSPGFRKGYALDIGQGITGMVAKTGRTELIGDVSKTPHYLAVRKDVKSELAVPIKTQQKVIGVLNIESEHENAFDQTDVKLLKAVADQAAVAINNARVTKSFKHSSERLQTINKIGKMINSSLDIDVIFKKFLDHVSHDLHFDFCAILMIESGRLYSRAGIGFTQKEIDTYNADLGEGICGVVAKTGKPILENDVRKSSIYKDQSPKTRSEMAVPMRVSGKVIGVLNVESKELNSFSTQDLEYLQLLGDQAAIAIRNAQQYGKIKNFTTELKSQVKAATIDLKIANKELEKLNQVKSEFVSTVSHELRTPLTSIQGYVSLIHDGEVGDINPEQKDFLSIVKQESERLTRLINDLLDVSKIESGKFKLIMRDLNLGNFLASYEKEVHNLASQQHLHVDFSVPKKLPTIKADADKVKQIFHNLVSNAIKFSPEKSTVKVVVHDNKEFIDVEVKDQGIGISKQDLPHIFEKFHRVDNSMTRQTGGTGLGLAITKYLVEAHGGTISVSSTVGKGSVFRFSLSKIST